MHNEIKR